MSDWTDEAELDENRTRRKGIRRAALGGIAGAAMLVGPIVLASAIVPEDESNDVEADGDDPNREAELVALRRQRQAAAAQEDLARANTARALRTTTTTEPPTTTTTEPPTTTTTEPPTTTTEPPPTTEAPPPPTGSGQLGDPYYYGSWDALAECESGGNWQINTGNGYYGGLQFSLSSWQGVGGTGYPHEHSRETQIQMGIRLWESSGWGAWPACTAQLGWR
jgi:hypothetical protein